MNGMSGQKKMIGYPKNEKHPKNQVKKFLSVVEDPKVAKQNYIEETDNEYIKIITNEA